MKPMLELFPGLKAIILDMDGVLWKDKEPIGDLPGIFAEIDRLGLQVILATNNATKNVSEYLEKLAGFAVNLQPEQIINSAMACVAYLQEKYPPKSLLYVIGTPSLANTLREAHFEIAPEGERVMAVVAGLDRQFTYAKLRNATVEIYHGAEFIGTNPDRTFPTPEGLVPGAGSILAAIEAATYTAPTIVGKPSPLMYQLALARLGVKPSETLAVGDRFDTDIVGGQRAGIQTALVLSGVEGPGNSSAWDPKPDCIARDLTELIFGP